MHDGRWAAVTLKRTRRLDPGHAHLTMQQEHYLRRPNIMAAFCLQEWQKLLRFLNRIHQCLYCHENEQNILEAKGT